MSPWHLLGEQERQGEEAAAPEEVQLEQMDGFAEPANLKPLRAPEDPTSQEVEEHEAAVHGAGRAWPARAGKVRAEAERASRRPPPPRPR